MNVLLRGYGRMGKRLATLIEADESHQLVGIIDVNGEGDATSFSAFAGTADVIIDFSHPDGIEELLHYVLNHQLPCVLATTNYSADQQRKIDLASEVIPILQTSNTAYGVQILLDAVRRLHHQLPDADVELVETHHKHKIDAPSGTAKMILNELKTGGPEVHGRHGEAKREAGEIGVHSIRGGNVVGVHEVRFHLDDEIITVRHEALSRDVFARGAIRAAAYLIGQRPGRYTMTDMLKEDQ